MFFLHLPILKQSGIVITSEWRSHIPSNGLNTTEEHAGRLIPITDFMQYGNDTVQAVVGPADVIVVQRNLIRPEVWEACDYWRGLGKLVVADLDDDYPHLTPQNPAYNFWILDKAGLEKQFGYKPIAALEEGFRHVDGLVSPNELIIKDWEERLPGFRGYWQPNYAHWPWYKDIEQKAMPEGDESIIVGWGGSVSHWDSWWFSGLREAVPELTAKYPHVTWKICGGDARVKRFFDDIAPGRWINQEGVPPEKWPLQVASFDIGLAPLCGPDYPQGERYDQRRSWLKAVEYLLAGVPWLASKGIVYEKLDGQGGHCIKNTPEAWFDAVSEMADNLTEYKAASKTLMPWARDNLTMEHVVDKYLKIFAEIWADRNARQGVRLPSVLYAADLFEKMEEIGGAEIIIEEDDMETLERLQAQTWRMSETWHENIDIEYSGVDLGKLLQYPLLAHINTVAYGEIENG